jgi:hypothetical protein
MRRSRTIVSWSTGKMNLIILCKRHFDRQSRLLNESECITKFLFQSIFRAWPCRGAVASVSILLQQRGRCNTWCGTPYMCNLSMMMRVRPGQPIADSFVHRIQRNSESIFSSRPSSRNRTHCLIGVSIGFRFYFRPIPISLDERYRVFASCSALHNFTDPEM